MNEILYAALMVLSAVSATIWIVLLFARGAFWRDGPYLGQAQAGAGPWPHVVAVIPARNEEGTIGETVSSLCAQNYPGRLSIVVVNDQSTDATEGVARRAARESHTVHVLSGTDLPLGWTGKLWAVSQGLHFVAAHHGDAEYVLLTDADIVHGPNVLLALVSAARTQNLGLVSQMVSLRCESFWERLLIPAFIFFFKKLYPFAWVNDPARATAAAAGGCMLVHRDTLAAAGGIEHIRSEIIDDCALARSIKPLAPIWLGLTRDSKSLRRYDCLADVWGMVTRTAFVQLRQSLWLVAGTLLGMSVIYLLPPIGTLVGFLTGRWDLAVLPMGCWIAMARAYRPTLALYGLPTWHGVLLPVAAFLYTCMTFASAYRALAGSGPRWKDRSYGAGMGPIRK